MTKVTLHYDLSARSATRISPTSPKCMRLRHGARPGGSVARQNHRGLRRVAPDEERCGSRAGEPRDSDSVSGGRLRAITINILGVLGQVFAQQSRQGAVGSNFRWSDTSGNSLFRSRRSRALDVRAASQAALLIAAVNRHAFAECGDLLREAIAHVFAKVHHPARQRRWWRANRPFDLVGRKFLRERQGATALRTKSRLE